MGKRKAVDLPAPLNVIKKQKKRPRKQANKTIGCGPKALDEIDLLFEEVEAILNSKMVINGTLPPKKALPQPKRIQEVFNKKKKGQTIDSVKLIDGVGNLPNTNDTILPSQQGTTGSVTNFSLSQGISQVEEVESIPLALSPEIRLVPNLQCRNEFELLAEEGDLIRDHEHLMVEPDIEVSTSPPITTTLPEPSASEVNLPLILQRVDEVRNLVLQLAKFLQGKTVYPLRCKCQVIEVAGKGGTLVVESIPFTSIVHAGPANHS
ncbi:hypothetical protein NDU88_002602 [Pleurodeles waltl]|uniref:Uncharacterized protein n=1 Tax=Pleurodeles waltl TaxID=8319 RepID=A0AAV7NI54_PLEWA|nr:hypothetical protein NDU88_002602 [Pleurodeles waltl]